MFEGSTNASNMASLVISVRGVKGELDVVELLSVEAMKSTAAGEDLYRRLSAILKRHEISWDKLIGVSIDGSPNLTDKNPRPSKMMEGNDT
jgi:hypothetical protein